MKIITVESLISLIKLHGFENFMKDLISCLKDEGEIQVLTKSKAKKLVSVGRLFRVEVDF